MNQEQKDWYKQLGRSFGAKEFLRFGCAFLFWILLGTTLAVWLRAPVIELAFLLAVFVFAPIATRWRPAYRVLRTILGNRDMPAEPCPSSAATATREPRPWWSFIAGIWFWLLAILVLYLALRYLAR